MTVTEPHVVSLERGVDELLACSRQVVALTDELCERVREEEADTLAAALQERDMLLVRLVELREQLKPMLVNAAERETIAATFRNAIGHLGGSDRMLMERLQERKQKAFSALVEAQRQQQLTNYIR